MSSQALRTKCKISFTSNTFYASSKEKATFLDWCTQGLVKQNDLFRQKFHLELRAQWKADLVNLRTPLVKARTQVCAFIQTCHFQKYAPAHRISRVFRTRLLRMEMKKQCRARTSPSVLSLLTDYQIVSAKPHLLQPGRKQTGFEIPLTLKRAPQTLCGILLQLRLVQLSSYRMVHKSQSEVGEKVLKSSGKNQQ